LPLAHIFETIVMNLCLYGAAAIGFYQGDTLKIVEDLQALRPTVFVSVPRLYNRIYDKVVGGAKAKGGIAALLFEKALATKIHNLHETGALTHGFWDRLVFSKVTAQLGLDRCRIMITGSAPIAPKVKDFMRVACGARIIEGYGLTETAAAATISHPDDASNGHVGIPTICSEIKLVDVPEMDYRSTNAPPTGEVCVRGPNVFQGYYKDKAKTDEAFDGSGWFHTGDIGRWNADGTLSIIDRKKNIFKLAQGEYVAAEKIENVMARCALVGSCFIHGDSLQSCARERAQPRAAQPRAEAMGPDDEPRSRREDTRSGGERRGANGPHPRVGTCLRSWCRTRTSSRSGPRPTAWRRPTSLRAPRRRRSSPTRPLPR
jgi:long-chain acyl-CoA synthetase